MKFGGASVETPSHFSKIADIIIDRSRIFSRLVIVVSAMGRATDELLELALAVNPNPPRREQDMLVSVGERVSISLLAMALAHKGKEAMSFTGSQSGVITTGDHAEARIVDVRPYRLLKRLTEQKIVIVAGFQGVSVEGEITTLGRGGSDTSAVALAAALGAERVEFYKDVPGIFDKDPKQNSDAKIFSNLTHAQAIQIAREGAKVLHLRSLLLAEKNALPLWVIPFSNPQVAGTKVFTTGLHPPEKPVYESEVALV